MDITESKQTSNHHFYSDAKGNPFSQSCLVKTLATMIGINQSPSSQFVPAHLHKPHRKGGVSRDRRRMRSGLRDQGNSPPFSLEADSGYYTNCLEPCLCECNCSLEIPYRLDLS